MYSMLEISDTTKVGDTMKSLCLRPASRALFLGDAYA